MKFYSESIDTDPQNRYDILMPTQICIILYTQLGLVGIVKTKLGFRWILNIALLDQKLYTNLIYFHKLNENYNHVIS
jgi:hypothetical protein